MKKLLLLLLTFTILIGCAKDDEFLEPITNEEVPQSLQIKDFSADNTIVLPSSAIKKDMRGSFVFVAEGNKAIKTYVEVGLSQGAETHVKAGLEFGQKVITVGFDEVSNGSIIEIKN